MVSYCDDILMTGQEFAVIKCKAVAKMVLTKWFQVLQSGMYIKSAGTFLLRHPMTSFLSNGITFFH